jgi:hypothetical protein
MLISQLDGVHSIHSHHDFIYLMTDIVLWIQNSTEKRDSFESRNAVWCKEPWIPERNNQRPRQAVCRLMLSHGCSVGSPRPLMLIILRGLANGSRKNKKKKLLLFTFLDINRLSSAVNLIATSASSSSYITFPLHSCFLLEQWVNQELNFWLG